MTKFKIIIVLAVFTVLVFTSCSRHVIAQKDAKQYYYDCPMHKDYIAYQPGKCPTCGMTLDRWDMDKMQKRNISNSRNSNSHNVHTGSGSYGGSSGGHQH